MLHGDEAATVVVAVDVDMQEPSEASSGNRLSHTSSTALPQTATTSQAAAAAVAPSAPPPPIAAGAMATDGGRAASHSRSAASNATLLLRFGTPQPAAA